MALSRQLTPTTVLLDYLTWAVRAGFTVGEHPDHGGVTPGVHRAGSWHGDGLAADLNHGTNGAAERAHLLVALAEAERRGLAVTYARDGTVGSARTHQNHLHVDVGEWSNHGRGLVRRTPPTGTAAPSTGTSPSSTTAATSPQISPSLREVQARLNRDYPAYSRLVVDGIDGPRTRAAVSEFQRRSGLVPDGVAGPLTRARLGLG